MAFATASNSESLLNRYAIGPVYMDRPERKPTHAALGGSDLSGAPGPALPARREGGPGGTGPHVGKTAALLHPPTGGRGAGCLGRSPADLAARPVRHRGLARAAKLGSVAVPGSPPRRLESRPSPRDLPAVPPGLPGNGAGRRGPRPRGL